MQITQVHRHFAAEVTGITLNGAVPAELVASLKQAIEDYGVVIIRDQQAMSDDDQLAFCRHFGPLQKSITVHREDTARRLRKDELSDISNVDESGARMAADDRRRTLQLPARLWHSDNSFRDPPGLYTFLAAKIVPDEGGDTEFADMRAAYDALDPEIRRRIDGLRVIHSLDWSREQSGAPRMSENEKANLPDTEQPLVRVLAGGRRSLYLSSHGRDVVGMDVAEGRALLAELTAFATRPEFVFTHTWRAGDVVVWDNRSTMHRATPFPEDRYKRDMRRTSIEDHVSAVAA